MNNKKVYCQNCKYLRKDMLFGIDYNCDYPDNIEEKITYDNWYSRITKNMHKRNPASINEFNNCRNYERK